MSRLLDWTAQHRLALGGCGIMSRSAKPRLDGKKKTEENLDDVLARNSQSVCGTAEGIVLRNGERTTRAGNRFWRTLAAVGLLRELARRNVHGSY